MLSIGEMGTVYAIFPERGMGLAGEGWNQAKCHHSSPHHLIAALPLAMPSLPQAPDVKKRHRYLQDLQKNLSPSERFYKVVTDAMCIGCGLCQSIVGEDRIRMRLVQNLTERPVITGELDAASVNRIYRVCPATRVEGLPESLTEPDSGYDKIWGVWRRLVLAWAADPAIRYLGSTGGLLTALALYLLEEGEVDFVVHARASKTHPAFGERAISRCRDDVLSAAGSRYGPTATLVDILEILDRAESAGERFAFIGTPCDVTGLRNLATEDARVDALCRYQLAMVCGGFMAPVALQRYLQGLGVAWRDLQTLRYRGHGCPGPTQVETVDETVIEKNYLDFWGEDESAWHLPFRCKVCPDGIGDAADLAAADSWEGGAPSREGQEDDPGQNAVIVRTRRGEQMLARAVATGYVATGDPLTPRDMDRLQPHQVAKKRAVWARFVGMRNANRIVPDVARLRLKSLARTNPFAENLSQARGTKHRCVASNHQEALPEPLE